MPTFTRIQTLALLPLLLLSPAMSGHAQDIASDDTQSLDGQVQEIKSDVLGIAAEISNLEERLLYPSGTQLALFVAMAEADEKFRLDAIQVAINGELATHHIYSFKELEALQKGGVQRVYMGNVPTGEHDLTVTITGMLDNGKDYSETQNVRFAKGVAPKALGITLADSGLGGSRISVGDW